MVSGDTLPSSTFDTQNPIWPFPATLLRNSNTQTPHIKNFNDKQALQKFVWTSATTARQKDTKYSSRQHKLIHTPDYFANCNDLFINLVTKQM